MLPFLMAVPKTPAERFDIAEYYDRYKAALIRTADRILHNQSDAEDAVHDVFLAAYRHWGSISEKGDAGIRRTLFVCTRNRAVSMIRRRKKLASLEEVSESGSTGRLDPADAFCFDPATDAVIAEDIKAAIDSLDQRLADVLWMHIEGFSIAETADLIGEKRGTIKKRLYRGRKKLNEILEGKGRSAK